MTKRKNFETNIDVAEVEAEVVNAGVEVTELAAEIAAVKKEVAALKEEIEKKSVSVSGNVDPRVDKLVDSLKLLFLGEGTYEEKAISHKKGKQLIEKI